MNLQLVRIPLEVVIALWLSIVLLEAGVGGVHVGILVTCVAALFGVLEAEQYVIVKLANRFKEKLEGWTELLETISNLGNRTQTLSHAPDAVPVFRTRDESLN